MKFLYAECTQDAVFFHWTHLTEYKKDAKKTWDANRDANFFTEHTRDAKIRFIQKNHF